MSIIEDIYFGNLSPNEIEIEKGSEMDIQLKRMIHIQEELIKLLSRDQNDLFEKLLCEQSKMNSLSECKAFENGVRLGVKLMAEVFADKEKPEE